jgi:hypothetical protein
MRRTKGETVDNEVGRRQRKRRMKPKMKMKMKMKKSKSKKSWWRSVSCGKHTHTKTLHTPILLRLRLLCALLT